MRIIGLQKKDKLFDKKVMLYGKRILEPQRLVHAEDRKALLINKSFQSKYILYFMVAITGSALLFFVPTLYFVNQNYDLFYRLAYDTAPRLVTHLEREIQWLNIFMFVSLTCIAGITSILGFRITRNLLNPLVSMEKHMRQLMLGNWSIQDFKTTSEEDYKDLSVTYDYFYRALKANTEMELELLEKLSIDPLNREAHAAWTQLLKLKRERLGLSLKSKAETNDSASKSGEVVGLRRVS